MVTYNPNSPNSIGVEWDVATESVTPLTTPTTCAAFYVPSTVTESVTSIYLPHTWTGSNSGFGKLVVDVYDAADALSGTIATTTGYAPTGDNASSNVYAPYPWVGVGVGTTYTKVADGVTYDDSNYLAFPNTSYARMKFGTAGFTGQAASISFSIRAFGYLGTTSDVWVELYNNTTWVSQLGTLNPPANGDDTHKNFVTYNFGPFTTNPLTGVAWTAADIVSFSTGTNLLLQIYANRGNVAVSWVEMYVTTSGVDKRKATGSTVTQTTLPAGTQTNLPVTFASAWSKVNGTNYLLVARRLDDPKGLATTLIPQPIYLGTAASPWTGKSYTSTIDASGVLTAIGSVDTTKTYPFWLTVGGAMSVDSMPYWDLVPKLCHTSSTLKQFVANASAQAYKGVRAMVAYSSTVTPTVDLTVKLKRTSDNVQFGGNGTITTAITAATTAQGTVTDATWGALSFKLVSVDLASSGTLAAATDYYLEFTSTTAATNPWFVLMLDGTASHPLTGNTTYGGATDQANVAGTGVPQGDLICRINSTPVSPSSITVTNTTGTINGTSVDYAAISWVNGGSLGAAFSRWEVDRSEDGGTTWVNSIVTIATEATVTFNDYEGKRSNANKYRVRSVRTDGGNSDYTTQAGTVTPAAVVGAKALFTTNASSSLTVGYVPHGTSATYGFLSAAETVYMRLHNRDYQASFKPLEQRGLQWSFQVQVWVGQSTPTGGAGVQAYTTLRALADSGVPPYLCLHTGDGERFFGTITVSAGERDVVAGVYLATVTFTQTQATSSTVAL